MIMAGEALDSDAMPVLSDSCEQLIATHRGAVPTLSSLPGRINKDTMGEVQNISLVRFGTRPTYK